MNQAALMAIVDGFNYWMLEKGSAVEMAAQREIRKGQGNTGLGSRGA